MTPIVALRGEIGASLFKTRIIQTKLTYIQSTIIGNRNELVKTIMDSLFKYGNTWRNEISNLLKETEITLNELRKLNREEIKRRIKEYDKKKWVDEINAKSSLSIYKSKKIELGGAENLYDNRPASITLFQARTNSLPLRARVPSLREGGNCPMCEYQEENLEHFILECPGYAEVRVKMIKLQMLQIENKQILLDQFYSHLKIQMKWKK